MYISPWCQAFGVLQRCTLTCIFNMPGANWHPEAAKTALDSNVFGVSTYIILGSAIKEAAKTHQKP